MPDKNTRNRKIITDSFFYIIAIIAAYYFIQVYFVLNSQFEPASISAFLNHGAATTFQYRVLVPWLVNWLYGLKIPLSFFNTPLKLCKLIEFCSFFFLLVVFRYYISLFFKDKLISTLLSFTLFCMLPFNFLLPRQASLWFPWDMPSILFFTLGLILLYKKNWLLYYPLFVVATLNRETACFLTCVYLFTAIGKSKPKTIIFHCSLQLVIWGTIKYALYNLYADNSGYGLFDTRFSENVDFFLNPRNLPLFFSNMGLIWIPVLFYFRLIRVEFVKRSLLVALPFFFGMMWVGRMCELRIFGELIPVVLTAFLLILRELFKRESASAG